MMVQGLLGSQGYTELFKNQELSQSMLIVLEQIRSIAQTPLHYVEQKWKKIAKFGAEIATFHKFVPLSDRILCKQID